MDPASIVIKNTDQLHNAYIQRLFYKATFVVYIIKQPPKHSLKLDAYF
jgi:hypothetical protein